MVIVKGVLAAMLAGLGVFAMYSASADPAADNPAYAAHCPPMGLAGLLRPLEH